MTWLLKELGRWLSAQAFYCRSTFCGRSKGVLAVQLCAAEPVGTGCELAWELQIETLLLTTIGNLCGNFGWRSGSKQLK